MDREKVFSLIFLKSNVEGVKILSSVWRLICHRIPERTFKIRGYYFPVCSRCIGIYTGAFSYFIFNYFFHIFYYPLLTLFAFLIVIPTFSDGLTQFIGLRMSNNMLRLFTGILAGIGLGILVKTIKFSLIT